MGGAVKWVKDCTMGTFLDADGQKGVVYDEYAIWMLKWGIDFLPSAQINSARNSDEDFLFFLQSKTLTSVLPPITSAVNIQIPPIVFKALDNDFPPPETFSMIAPLPIRKEAVADATKVSLDGAHEPADSGLNKEKLVIVGIIDDGVNVFNRRFTPNGRPSRIEYAWVQDAPAKQAGPTVFFGAELTSQDITDMLLHSGLTETEMMVAQGLTPGARGPYMPTTLNRPYSHGTSIADLAAGQDPALNKDGEVNTRLITVQLPALSVSDTSGASLISAAQAGAIYIFERALRMSLYYEVPIPVVLNFSFGISGGARTGQHFLERAFRALGEKYRQDVVTALNSETPPVVRVIAAGNENLMRLHANNNVGGDTFRLPVRVLPDDHTSSFLEVWLPQSTRSVKIKITTPDGQVFDVPEISIKPSTRHAAYILSEGGQQKDPVARVSLDEPLHELPREFQDDNPLYWRVLLAIAPTASNSTRRRLAPAGLWHMEVTPDANGQAMQAWIQKDQPVSGMNPLGRQPYFDDDHLGPGSYEATAFDALGDVAVDDPVPRRSVIARNGSLSGIASNDTVNKVDVNTKEDTVSVGAMRWDTHFAAPYSSAAPDGAMEQAPHVMSVAENSRVLPNLKTTGTLSDTAGFISGTSAAAAVVSGFLAGQLSALGRDDYGRFNPHCLIPRHGTGPKRPNGPEIATENKVRIARLKKDGVLLEMPSALSAYVSRDCARK